MSFKYEMVFTANNFASNGITQITYEVQELNIRLDQTTEKASKTASSFRGLNSSITTGLLTATRDARTEFKNFDAETNRMAMSLRGLIFGLQMTAFSITMITSYMYSMESAQLSLQGAQERYNEALREHGAASSEARSALRSLEQAQINYQRSATMSQIMTISLGLQFVSLVISSYQAIPAIQKLTDSLKAYNTVSAISKAMNPWGWVALAGGIAIGAGAVYAINQMQNNQKSNVNVAIQYDEGVIAEFERIATNKTKNVGVVP
ncbi:MAG: hypothetical protein NWE98_02100 [Candidatus Bathyarchaeota archaeon]|nr:hypothetical protein [Candidatus Bathyarchaeota archaeon]